MAGGNTGYCSRREKNIAAFNRKLSDHKTTVCINVLYNYDRRRFSAITIFATFVFIVCELRDYELAAL